MTLFRKVFQNQSRPAEAEEALDEEALRAAFQEMRETRTPLILDPFAHAADRSEEASSTEDGYGAEASDDKVHLPLAAQDDATVETAQDVDARFEAEIDALEQELEAAAEESLDVANADEDAPVLPSSSDEVPASPFQKDDEIVANLGRALAEEAPELEPEVDLSDDTRIEDDLVEDGASAEDNLFANGASHAPAPFTAELAAEEDAEATQGNASFGQDATAAFAQAQMSALAAQAPTHEPPAEELTPVVDVSEELNLSSVTVPATGRAGRRTGRAKTRVLGFNRGEDAASDPFGATPEATATPQREKFPVGWLVIVEGPGVGHSFSIFSGASMIGRGDDQMICLDFGDNSISRNNHAAIAYDEEQNKFYVGHGGKSNIIRRNARPVLSTEELHHADLIRIGETTLRFVALCGSDFRWNTAEHTDAAGV